MKYLLIPLFCALRFFASAQCEFAENETDKFEKVEKVMTKDVKVRYSYPVMSLAIGRVDSAYFVRLRLVTMRHVCLNERSEMAILCADGKVYRMQHEGPSLNCSDRDGSQQVTVGHFRTTRADLEALSLTTPESIRVYTTDGNIEGDMTKGNPNRKKAETFFFDNVKCALNQ